MSKDKDKKKDEAVEPDTSTPDPLNAPFTTWIERLFSDGERVLFIKATQALGRHGTALGAPIDTIPIKSAPQKGDFVVMANRLWQQFLEEAEAMHETRRFLVEALSDLKGGVFAAKIVKVEPVRTGLMRRDGRGVVGDDDVDDGDITGRDPLLKRTKTILDDGQWWAAHTSQVAGDHIQLLVEQNKDLYALVKEMLAANIAAMKAKNDAENNALDRELAREQQKFRLDLQRRGFNLLAAIVPGAVERITDGGVKMPGGRSTESVTIEQIMQDFSNEEKVAIFGEWSEEKAEDGRRGKRLKPGILDEEQVRIIVGIMNDEVKPEAIKRLIDEQSKDVVSPSQLYAISKKVPMDRLVPLLEIFNKWKQIVDEERKKPQAAN